MFKLRELVKARHAAQARGDDGVALVAAVAVGIIGIVLTTLVVSQAIIVTNDASRDRLRTTEIHSAEGALDAALREMETGLRCTPSFSPLIIGEGPSQVEATVTIEYFDEDDNALTVCGGDYIEGDAVFALVTSTAVPTNPVPGIDPARTIQAEVRIVPNKGLSTGSSIFADSDMLVQNNATVESSNPDHPADIWLDSGNFNCDNSLTVRGSVIVVDGGITMRNSCKIEYDAWAKTYMTVSTSVNGWRVGRDVTVAQGNFTHANNSKYGGNMSVSGTISGNPEVAGNICSTNVGSPCPAFDLYEPRGFPEVFYIPSDWGANYTAKNLATFTSDMIETGGFKSGSTESEFAANPCEIKKQWLKNNTAFKLNDDESSGSLYDLRSCDVVWEGVTLKIYQDTAFFMGSFRESNGLSIESGDGQPHDVWIIVPFDSTGNNNITLSNQAAMPAPISVFLYTPGTVQTNNNQTIHGQIYGKQVNLTNQFTLSYDPMGIPGVDLGGGVSLVNSGYSIEIEKKRELRN